MIKDVSIIKLKDLVIILLLIFLTILLTYLGFILPSSKDFGSTLVIPFIFNVGPTLQDVIIYLFLFLFSGLLFSGYFPHVIPEDILNAEFHLTIRKNLVFILVIISWGFFILELVQYLAHDFDFFVGFFKSIDIRRYININ